MLVIAWNFISLECGCVSWINWRLIEMRLAVILTACGVLSLVLLALAPVILASIEVALGLIAVPPGGACENAVPKGVVTIVLIVLPTEMLKQTLLLRIQVYFH